MYYSDSHKRDPKSIAVIELRRVLGKTQQDFGYENDIAATTVARYETSHPPFGEALLRIAKVAKNNNQPELMKFFKDEYIKEALARASRI